MRADHTRPRAFHWGMAFALVLTMASGAWAQTSTAPASTAKPSMTIYGAAMLDLGQNLKTINPDWYDTMRVTKLPSFAGQFGVDNSTFAGVRQSRLGVKATMPTSMGDLKTTFEFELFGVGVDEGQTTFRLRHAYGELGHFGAGQTWSVFMDPDVFPNSLEYWGPTGMVFFRNVQFRYMPIQGDKQSLTIALEKPGASGDPGTLADRVELQNVQGRNVMPDITGQYTMGGTWGYVRVAGVVRRITWDDTLQDQYDLSGHTTGWGLNFSSNLKPGKNDVIRIQVVYGEGIQNYMNDSPVDIGIVANPGNAKTPILGKAIPILGTVFFLDHTWNDKFTSAIGFSHQDNSNTEGQAPDAFKRGYYALGNLLYMPVPNVMMGGEFQWGRRENFSDGWKYDGYKVQFSFKYNFSYKIGG
jgi:hypothetical protein